MGKKYSSDHMYRKVKNVPKREDQLEEFLTMGKEKRTKTRLPQLRKLDHNLQYWLQTHKANIDKAELSLIQIPNSPIPLL